LKNIKCQASNFGAAKVLAASKDAAEKKGGVNGGNLGIPNSFACGGIREVVIEAPLIRHLCPEKTQRCQHTLAGICKGDIAPFLCDTDSGQPEARGRDARHRSFVRTAHIAAVLY